MKSIFTPFSREKAIELTAGDQVEISGEIFAARDAAHRKLADIIDKGGAMPFDIKDQIIYYVGPCPAPPGRACGSAGPTTSGRMDIYTPRLIGMGLRGMIGKGSRSIEVVEAMKVHGAVYFGAIGGAGALISRSIISTEMVAFPELGPEAVIKMMVEKFPAIVVIDSCGNDLYETGKRLYSIK